MRIRTVESCATDFNKVFLVSVSVYFAIKQHYQVQNKNKKSTTQQIINKIETE